MQFSIQPLPQLHSHAADSAEERADLHASPAEGLAALTWIGALVRLVARALDEKDDETLRRIYEDEILRRVGVLRAAGLFDVFQIVDPALRAMVDDAFKSAEPAPCRSSP